MPDDVHKLSLQTKSFSLVQRYLPNMYGREYNDIPNNMNAINRHRQSQNAFSSSVEHKFQFSFTIILRIFAEFCYNKSTMDVEQKAIMRLLL